MINCKFCDRIFETSHKRNSHLGWCEKNPSRKIRTNNLQGWIDGRRKIELRNCKGCGTSFRSKSLTARFCSQICVRENQFQEQIKKWKSGEITGLDVTGVVIPSVKKYLRRKYDDKCCRCGWSEMNEHTKKIPLVADHIDGNWKHNTEENLRLICPNCDSLSKTYGGGNRGNGRKMRYHSSDG